MVIVLALAALCAAVYLAVMSGSGGDLAGCNGTGTVDCGDVLGSRWSQWLGIPVSYPAIGVYVAILAASGGSRWASYRAQVRAEVVLLGLSLMAAGASFWFIFLQAAVIGKFCLYCMVCHVCGLIIGGLVLWPVLCGIRQKPSSPALRASMSAVPPGRTAGPTFAGDMGRYVPWSAGAAALGVLALVLGQLAVRPQTFVISDMAGAPGSSPADTQPSAGPADANAPSSDDLVLALPIDGGQSPGSSNVPAGRSEPVVPEESAGDRRREQVDGGAKGRTVSVTLAQGPVALDVYDHPLLGSPTAPHVAVQLFDYTCPKCRETHQQFEQVRARYGNQLAIMVLPVPLASQCNRHIPQTQPLHAQDCRYARLALAVWRLRPSEFESYHTWLMQGRQVPPFDAAARRAVELLGNDQLKKAVNDPDLTQRLAQYVELFGAIGKRLPAVMVGDKLIRGVPGPVREWFGFFEGHLQLRPLAP